MGEENGICDVLKENEAPVGSTSIIWPVRESETFASLAQKDGDGCNGKQLDAVSSVSNGSVTLKQPFSVATDQRSSDVRQITEGNSNIASTRDTNLEAMPGATKQSLVK